jgi:hypothetical protein
MRAGKISLGRQPPPPVRLSCSRWRGRMSDPRRDLLGHRFNSPQPNPRATPLRTHRLGPRSAITAKSAEPISGIPQQACAETFGLTKGMHDREQIHPNNAGGSRIRLLSVRECGR